MIRHAIGAFFLVSLVAGAATAKTDEEKKAEIMQAAAGYVSQYSLTRDQKILAKAYPGIEKSWQAFFPLVGAEYPMIAEFSMMRARAATAANDKKRVVGAWREAIKYKYPKTTPQQLISIYTEAAQACAAADDYEASQQFFAAARAFAFVRGNNAEAARLNMRIQELMTTGGSMPWRTLKDSLTDLRKFSETFPMWTLPRLDAVLAEINLRIQYQPESDEKRSTLSTLKAEVMLMVDGLDEKLPTEYLARVRQTNYALEDLYSL